MGFSGGHGLVNRLQQHRPSTDQVVQARTMRLTNRSSHANGHPFPTLFSRQRAPSTETTARWLTASGDTATGPTTSPHDESTAAKRWLSASGNTSEVTPLTGCSRRGRG